MFGRRSTEDTITSSMEKRFLWGLRGHRLQVAVAVIAGMDFLLFGYDQGVTGGLLTLESFYTVFPTIDTTSARYKALSPSRQNHVSTIQGLVVATYNLGCLTGAVPTIWIGNWLGRRKTIFVGSFIMVIGAILQSSSYSVGQLVVGRLVTGFGNGLNTSTVPTWQSECSRSHRRGPMVMIEGAMITCGIMISYWIDFALLFADPNPVAWRFPLAFQTFFAIIILAFVLKLPESPRWLILKGREDEALHVLATLSDLPADDRTVHKEFIEIRSGVLEESSGNFKELFTTTKERHFHRTVLAYVNQVFQQISGINLITYYIPNIIQGQIGLSPTKAKVIAACNGTEYFAASWIAVFTIERFGRRGLMLFGSVGMTLCMVVLAITDSIGTSKAGIASIVFLFGFNTFFAVGWLGMTWLYPAEIVPLKIRAPANALSTSANWIFNFMVVMITPVAFSSIGYQTYIIFAVINAFIIPVVYFFYPETAGRSLEEMDSIFRKTGNIFQTVSIARNEPRRYNKKGEMVMEVEDIDDETYRRASVYSQSRKMSSAGEKA